MTKNFKQKRSEHTEHIIEAELVRLKMRLWKARGRRSRITGVVFLFISGSFLILAYITRYIVFEVISILALLLGVVFVFTSMELYMKVNVANRAVISSLIPLTSLLNHLRVKSKAVYIPSASEKHSHKIFLPTQGGDSLPTIEEIAKDDSTAFLEKGILLPPIGSALLQLYEEELGDLRNFDLEYLMAWLPRVLVDGLKMAERVEITRKIDEIHVKITDSVFRYLCQQPAVKVVCEVTGCPVCSSIGEAISKNTGHVVYYLKCEYDPLTRETDIFYRLGPPLEELRQREKVDETSGNEC